jgi:hypothetical protein
MVLGTVTRKIPMTMLGAPRALSCRGLIVGNPVSIRHMVKSPHRSQKNTMTSPKVVNENGDVLWNMFIIRWLYHNSHTIMRHHDPGTRK